MDNDGQVISTRIQVLQIVYGIFIPITTLFYIGVCIVFYKKRFLQPIRARPLWSTISSILLLGVYSLIVCLGYVWIDGTQPCILIILFSSPAIVVCYNLVLYRVWLLWFRYKSTEEKTVVGSRTPFTSHRSKQQRRSSASASGNSSSSDDEQQVTLWYLTHKHYGEDRFLFKLFGAKSVIEVAFVLALIFAISPSAATEFVTPGTGQRSCSSLETAFWALVVICVFDGMISIYAATRFGVVEDGFSLKQELKNSSYFALACVCVIVPLNISVPLDYRFLIFTSLALTCLGITVNMGVYPIWLTYKTPQARSRMSSMSSSSAPRYDNFKALLESEIGRADFRHHLQLEFSVENLLFWEAIRDFRERFDAEAPADNWELADQIYQRYVTEDSQLQVNIDYVTLKEIVGTLNASNAILANTDPPPLPITVFDRDDVNIDYVTLREIVTTLSVSNSTLANTDPPPLPITVFDRDSVNIDYVTLREIVTTLSASNSTLANTDPSPLPITVFDRAEREIVRLMASDPFTRFKSQKMEEYEECSAHRRLNTETRSRGSTLSRLTTRLRNIPTLTFLSKDGGTTTPEPSKSASALPILSPRPAPVRTATASRAPASFRRPPRPQSPVARSAPPTKSLPPIPTTLSRSSLKLGNNRVQTPSNPATLSRSALRLANNRAQSPSIPATLSRYDGRVQTPSIPATLSRSGLNHASSRVQTPSIPAIQTQEV